MSLVQLKDFLLNSNASSDVKVDKCMRFIFICNNSVDENPNIKSDGKDHMEIFSKAQRDYVDKFIELKKS